MNDELSPLGFFATLVFWSLLVLLVLVSFTVGHKMYVVWAESKIGQAEFARAEYNKQIKTLEAKAAAESAKYLAEAEITRAEGVAKANQIIGQSLQENEAYLRYLWINNLNHNEQTVVYVPTEANLPILESTRMQGSIVRKAIHEINRSNEKH